MAGNNSRSTGFRIDNGPMSPQLHAEPGEAAIDLEELPHPFGTPLLFAIARDPRTLFVYWNIDWPTAFGGEEPKDKQVFLRVIEENGIEESESLIEPMLGSFYTPVAKPRSRYQVELGYYPRSGGWISVAVSEVVAMPPDRPSESLVVDVATVPFHLSFQKMVDLFCETNGDPLAVVLSRIQDKAVTTETPEELHTEEREILRAMNLTVDELRSGRRAFASGGPEEQTLRKRAEAILGFGSSSPAHGFDGSSWG